MTLTKKQIISVLLLLALVFSLPVAVYLTRKMQDVRPRALQGKANFLLSTDSITSTVGKNIDVLVTLQTTDPSLKVSGVDFLLLYDKNRLDVGNIVPNVMTVDPKAPFTEAPVVTSGGSFDENFNFIRVAQIARRTDADLPKGTFQLARITFRGRGTGSATIKFPDDDKYLEIVGTGSAGSNPNITPTITPGGPTLTPTITPGGPTLTPTITPGGPTLTPSPTITPGGPTLTPTPTLRPGQPTNTPVPQPGGGGIGTGGGTGGGVGGTGGTFGSGGRQGCQVVGCRTAGECCANSGNCVKCPSIISCGNGVCDSGESNWGCKQDCTDERQIGGPGGSVTSYTCGQQCDVACKGSNASAAACDPNFCNKNPQDCDEKFWPVGLVIQKKDGTIAKAIGGGITSNVTETPDYILTVTTNAGVIVSSSKAFKDAKGNVYYTEEKDAKGKLISETFPDSNGTYTSNYNNNKDGSVSVVGKNKDGETIYTSKITKDPTGNGNTITETKDLLNSSTQTTVTDINGYEIQKFISNSEGTVTTYYDPVNKSTDVTKVLPNGTIIDIFTDAKENVTTTITISNPKNKSTQTIVTYPDKSSKNIYEDPNGTTTKTTDVNGNTTTKVCDAAGKCDESGSSDTSRSGVDQEGQIDKGSTDQQSQESIPEQIDNAYNQAQEAVDEAQETSNVEQAVSDVVSIVTETVQNVVDTIRNIFYPPPPAYEPPVYIYEPSDVWSNWEYSGGDGSSGFESGDVVTVDEGINLGDFHRSEDWL